MKLLRDHGDPFSGVRTRTVNSRSVRSGTDGEVGVPRATLRVRGTEGGRSGEPDRQTEKGNETKRFRGVESPVEGGCLSEGLRRRVTGGRRLEGP